MIYSYVTTISFLTLPIYYKLQNALCADEYSVHNLNANVHMIHEVLGTVNITQRNVACLMLPDISSQTNLRAFCLSSVWLTENK